MAEERVGLHNLAPAPGSRKKRKRVGRGEGPGVGKTSRRRHLPADRGVTMIRTFMNSLRVPEIRKKLAFTAGMLALYRIGAYIPAPSINVQAVKDISQHFTGSNVLGFLNLFSGGGLQRF